MNKMNLDDKAQLEVLADSMEVQIGQAVRGTTSKNLAEISRLSSEAIYGQYEAAAKEVEDMGAVARDEIDKIEESIDGIAADTRDRIAKIVDLITAEVSEAARVARENGKKAQALVEEVGNISRTIRETCIEVKRRVGG